MGILIKMRIHLCLPPDRYNPLIPMYRENICSMRRMEMKPHGVFFRRAYGRPIIKYVSFVECTAFIYKSREEEFLGYFWRRKSTACVLGSVLRLQHVFLSGQRSCAR
ncbi:hypothetical protein VCUG_02423 [Vavraia culicis subsp. floridensis]|uniref:Uncharacterized protein n=1 Tax=Vavraia culicis (isolate floridensis) TaxID=948595 RepID=L2GS05_VAVCU|nr:uncharacterized protein VCUG_02423 [Vavraia culicis subsp. floridensis]ELA46088.1 hypothetical protein VCUG_02423 [Vavraia culicis subsp. floridensis]